MPVDKNLLDKITVYERMGYNPDEIVAGLAQSQNYPDIAEKMKAYQTDGYGSDEIVAGIKSSMPAPSGIAQTVSRYARPALEYGGMVGGSLLGGSPLTPTGIAGAGLGYAGGNLAANYLDEKLGLKQSPDMLNRVAQTGKAFTEGSMMEMGGGVLGNLVQRGGQWASGLPMRLYESAIKPRVPSSKFTRAEQMETLQAGMDAGIAPSQFGIDKLEGLIDDLNGQIMGKIQGGAKAGKVVSRDEMLNRLNDTEAFFSQMPNPEPYMKAIDEVRQGMIQSKAEFMPLDKVQSMKQTIYRVLKDSYGELSTATKEANKAIARGAKEELVNIFPELTTLNNKESLLLRLEPLIEKAVGRVQRRDLMGIGTPIAGMAAAAVAGPALGKTTLVAKALLDNPRAKTYVAILLNKANKGGMGMDFMDKRLAAYMAGKMAESNADQSR